MKKKKNKLKDLKVAPEFIPLRRGINPTAAYQLKRYRSFWRETNPNKQKRILAEELREQKEFLEMYPYFLKHNYEITYSHGWLNAWYSCHKKRWRQIKRKLCDTPTSDD